MSRHEHLALDLFFKNLGLLGLCFSRQVFEVLNKNNVNVQLTSQSVSKVCVAFH